MESAVVEVGFVPGCLPKMMKSVAIKLECNTKQRTIIAETLRGGTNFWIRFSTRLEPNELGDTDQHNDQHFHTCSKPGAKGTTLCSVYP